MIKPKLSDRAWELEPTMRRITGRCGVDTPHVVGERMTAKVKAIRTRFGGMYLDYELSVSEAVKHYSKVQMPDRNAHMQDGRREFACCVMDYTMSVIADNHPFITPESVGYDATQRQTRSLNSVMRTLAGTIYQTAASTVTMLGLRHYILTGKLGRSKASKKLSEWGDCEQTVRFYNAGGHAGAYYLMGYAKDGLLCDMPMSLVSGIRHSKIGEVGTLFNFESELIAVRAKTEQETDSTYRVRVSYDPDDPLTFGHWPFDQNACFQVQSQSPTAPPVISQCEEAVAFLIYNEKDRAVGRAWGRILYDGDTRDITSVIITNMYPNVIGTEMYRVRAALFLLMEKLGLTEEFEPELESMAPEGGWIYFNQDAIMFQKPGCKDPTKWIINNKSLPRRWKDTLNGRYYHPSWDRGFINGSSFNYTRQVNMMLCEVIEDLGMVFGFDGVITTKDLYYWAYGAERGMQKEYPDPPSEIELSADQRATLVDYLRTNQVESIINHRRSGVASTVEQRMKAGSKVYTTHPEQFLLQLAKHRDSMAIDSELDKVVTKKKQRKTAQTFSNYLLQSTPVDWQLPIADFIRQQAVAERQQRIMDAVMNQQIVAANEQPNIMATPAE